MNIEFYDTIKNDINDELTAFFLFIAGPLFPTADLPLVIFGEVREQNLSPFLTLYILPIHLY